MMDNRMNDRSSVLLGRLKNEVENAKTAAMSDKVLVDREEMLTLIAKLEEVNLHNIER